jgi:hypothetical protein
MLEVHKPLVSQKAFLRPIRLAQFGPICFGIIDAV